jgi:AraC family transcriptional regulator, ethanolamine operon transcriptional activator
MPFTMLGNSGHLTLQRFTNPGELQAIGFVDIEQMRLEGPYLHTRAITALPGALLLLERTSPRRLSATMSADGCTVIIPMTGKISSTFNNESWSASQIGLARRTVSFRLSDPLSSTFAVARFSSDMQNRGWRDLEGKMLLQNTDCHGLLHLQQVVRRIFALSSSMLKRDFAAAADALRLELIDALDGVLVRQDARTSRPRSFERHRKLVSKLDELVRATSDKPLYSDALAREIGTSVRTLQLAVKEVHGLSLHQHLRTIRLWALRAQLLKGLPGSTVSSTAMANGFFHMGELSTAYKATFGELPSVTLLPGKVT